MYKRRKLEGLRPLFSLFFGSAHPHSSKIYYPLFSLIKLAIPPKKKRKKEKIAQRNINSLRYVNDTTLRAESKEELSAS